MAIKIADLELSAPLTALEIEPSYRAVWLLARLYGRPLGYVKLPVTQNQIELDALKKGVVEQIAWNLDAHLTAFLLRQGGLQPANLEQFRAVLPQLQPEPLPEPTPKITVAVCTRDRPESLRRCLESLSMLDYPNFEVLVIDNAPKTAQTAQLVQNWPKSDPLSRRLRYLLEPRSGLSWGRNRAIEEAGGEIIAYTDDDVVVDPGWLKAIAPNFADNMVGCVTGLVVPLELETPAQELFEKYGGFGRGFVRKYYHYTSQAQPNYPLGAGIFGTGANTAYRRTIFDKIGLFDTTLGAGTATGGSEDHEIFFRLLKFGYALVYEPTALLRHQHRRDLEGLKMQLYNFGRAEMAYLTHLFLKYPDERRRVLGLVGWWFGQHGLRRMWRETRHSTNFPRRLILAEMRGSLSGPLAYFQSRRQARRIAAGQYDPSKIAPLWKEGEQVSSHAN